MHTSGRVGNDAGAGEAMHWDGETGSGQGGKATEEKE